MELDVPGLVACPKEGLSDPINYYLPAVCVFGSSWTDWHKIFARTKANESTDYMISLPTHGVVSGVWFGAWPMALDWESPWQGMTFCGHYPSGGLICLMP
ncbi:putative mitogen-activated protein kinase kinase kinase A-like [Capsicum annuum]|nr:putative mitogen-activated protein kinase kinase kinase A-like [Capsicum annuum]